jgi:cyanophycinase
MTGSTRLAARALAAAAVLVAVAAPAWAAGQRLVLVGGGDRPQVAVERFVEWAGGKQARVLVVPWASEEPDASFESIRAQIGPMQPAQIAVAPKPPLDARGKAQLADLLASATGVFFGGGDQARIMDALDGTPFLATLRERYAAGVVFGGTSAGTAALSSPMITGDGDFTVVDARQVKTRAGIGLLPGVILDQHFVKRSRQNRLFGLVLASPQTLGVGVDEDTALLVRDNRHAEVVGKGPVVMVDAKARKGALVVTFVWPGERFDLTKRERVAAR